MEFSDLKNLGYCCCFCNGGIKSADFDPCDLTIVSNFDKDKTSQQSQWFFCHVACFKGTLHQEVQRYFVADNSAKYSSNQCIDADVCDGSHKLFTCYICYEKIEIVSIDPCAINLTVNFDKEPNKQYSQLFYLHAKCFKQSLEQKMRQHFVLDLLENDD